MLYSWMIYVSLVGGLAAAGAWALERVARAYRLPTRWSWLAALVATVGFAIHGAWPRTTAGPDAAAAAATGPLPQALAPLTETVGRITSTNPAPEWDMIIALAWAGASVVVGLVVLRSVFGLVHDRSSWSRARVNGREILVSDSVGPAVVGFVRSAIVLPRWALTMEAEERELMLRHEEEHRSAGDLWLLIASVSLLVAMPWNPALWWCARRLRLAMEIDCDRRVLGAEVGLRRYAELLVTMTEHTTLSRAGALAFARPTPFLERRIRTMTDRKRPRMLRTLGLLALAAIVGVAACEIALPGVDSGVSETAAEEEANPRIVELETDDGEWYVARFESAPGGVISGSVIHRESGQGVEQVQIFIPEQNLGGLTNAQGRFLLLNVPEGRHGVQLQKNGAFGRFLVGDVRSLAAPEARQVEGPRMEGEGAEHVPMRPAPEDPATGTVTGTITHPETGEGVGAVQVVIEELKIGGLTNQQGRYLLLNVPVGTHTITFSQADVEVEAEVTVQAGQTMQVSRALEAN